MSDLRIALGRQIRKLRQARGLSQESLGERAGLSYKFVGEIERGSGNPTVDSLDAIASALKVPVTGLFGDDPARSADALTPQEFLVFRDAHDSLGQVLQRIGGWKKRRRRSRN